LDWMFDAVLQVLEGEAFDCAVMNFVDEHCEIFDSLEEENRLEYVELVRSFIPDDPVRVSVGLLKCTRYSWRPSRP
jgi:hypothetical protein